MLRDDNCCAEEKDLTDCCRRALGNVNFLKDPELHNSALYGPFDPASVMTYARNMGAKSRTFVFTYPYLGGYYIELLPFRLV